MCAYEVFVVDIFRLYYHFFYLCAMNQLFLHIEYTLHQHNCVIVPGLGGFVVNTIPSQKEDLSIFHSPKCELIFNSSLTYNDGLLTESYMRVYNIPFESASQKIDAAVKEVVTTLRDKRHLDLGDLGSFELNENNGMVYNSIPFERPEFYGLSTASLKPIIQLKPKTVNMPVAAVEEKKPRSIMPKIAIGAAVAAVVALIMLIMPMQDSVMRHQTAQIMTESNIFGNNEKPKKSADQSMGATANAVNENNGTMVTGMADVENETINKETDKPVGSSVASGTSPMYYIIVGVYEVRSVADKMLENLRSEGYTNCNTIDKSNRIDVYAASFTTREEANKIANELRQNANYRDAWVLKK